MVLPLNEKDVKAFLAKGAKEDNVFAKSAKNRWNVILSAGFLKNATNFDLAHSSFLF